MDDQRFSDRYGITKVRELIQIDSMDNGLRTDIWNMLYGHIWVWAQRRGADADLQYTGELNTFCVLFWGRYLRQPFDDMPRGWYKFYDVIKASFFSSKWWGVYNILEFILQHYPTDDLNDFVESINYTLVRNKSGYRIVDLSIVRITDDTEIDTIQTAVNLPVDPVRIHLRRALELLADREQPDYRNSVKESISAVESLAGTIVGENDSLGALVKRLQDAAHLHPAFAKGLSNLYGYTSDAKGIRHALMESDTVTFDEAKFFLVICSAFVNFVVASIPPTSATT